ncbi:MAG: Nodulin-related protein CC_0717, partial [uncultured Acidimicrobiales bacterium]
VRAVASASGEPSPRRPGRDGPGRGVRRERRARVERGHRPGLRRSQHRSRLGAPGRPGRPDRWGRVHGRRGVHLDDGPDRAARARAGDGAHRAPPPARGRAPGAGPDLPVERGRRGHCRPAGHRPQPRPRPGARDPRPGGAGHRPERTGQARERGDLVVRDLLHRGGHPAGALLLHDGDGGAGGRRGPRRHRRPRCRCVPCPLHRPAHGPLRRPPAVVLGSPGRRDLCAGLGRGRDRRRL